MSLLIDIILILIVGFSAWRGYKTGIIRGITGILALIIALYGGSVLASAYSGEVSTMLRPFVIGVVDKSLSDVLNDDGSTSTVDEITVNISLSEEDKKDTYKLSWAALRNLGLSEKASALISESTKEISNIVGQDLSVNLTRELCSTLGYVIVFGIAFILIAIIFAVIGNIISLTFSIPGIKLIDSIAGAVLGAARGIIIVLALASLLRYIGLIVPEKFLLETTLLKWIIESNPIANIIGI